MTRPRTYYLPWIIRPGLECALVLSNVEARFKPELSAGPFPVNVVQYDARGHVAHRYHVTLADSTDTVEVPLRPAAGGCGFATVSGERLHSDLYVTLSDGHDYTATHGREEFIEGYPGAVRLLVRAACAVTSVAGRTVPAFMRNQFVYLGPESRSHVLLMNLSNVPNRIRAMAGAGERRSARACSGCRRWGRICSTSAPSAPLPRRAPPSGGSSSRATPGSTCTWWARGRRTSRVPCR